jgi:hypothetical protein
LAQRVGTHRPMLLTEPEALRARMESAYGLEPGPVLKIAGVPIGEVKPRGGSWSGSGSTTNRNPQTGPDTPKSRSA